MTFSQIAFTALALLFGAFFTWFGVATLFGKVRAAAQRSRKPNERVMGFVILAFGIVWLAVGALVWFHAPPVEGPNVEIEVGR
jgi:hypothetical protein